MAIAGPGHPFGTGQMRVEGLSGAIRLRIHAQHNPRNLARVGTSSVGIKQPEVGHQMVLIMDRQPRLRRRRISNIGTDRGLLDPRQLTSWGPLRETRP
jgi:hypothetical protein